jgi:hypothetical protein
MDEDEFDTEMGRDVLVEEDSEGSASSDESAELLSFSSWRFFFL